MGNPFHGTPLLVPPVSRSNSEAMTACAALNGSQFEGVTLVCLGEMVTPWELLDFIIEKRWVLWWDLNGEIMELFWWMGLTCFNGVKWDVNGEIVGQPWLDAN